MPRVWLPAAAADQTRQCAWCHRVADHSGRNGQDPQDLLQDATHGICPPFGIRFRTEIEAA
jgi:hypothetical protein